VKATNYKLTDPVAGFEEGDILDVTARFGDWHVHDLKLEPRDTARRSRPATIVVTDRPAGFSEAEILDPTARFGDWHTFDLAYDPVADDDTSRHLELTVDELEAIAEPVEPTA